MATLAWGAYDAPALPFRVAGRERDVTNTDHRSIVRFAITPLCALALLFAGGCQLFQGQIAPERRPTVVGIIVERGLTETNDFIVTLVDGSRVTLPRKSETLTAGSSAGPDELLLADPTAAQPWFVSIPRQTAGCFALTAPYAEIREDVLVMANGLVLPQAPDFVAGPARCRRSLRCARGGVSQRARRSTPHQLTSSSFDEPRSCERTKGTRGYEQQPIAPPSGVGPLCPVAGTYRDSSQRGRPEGVAIVNADHRPQQAPVRFPLP